MKAIDLFAGSGGFSLGAVGAGVDVVWAANHWPLAVKVHAQNHPETEHLCQDLHQANWLNLPKHDMILASPACQGHSKARGKDRPSHDSARSTAWAVVSAAEAHRPPICIIENVPDYLNWTLFPAWEAAMKALGYQVSYSVLDAQYFHIPQMRKRIFIVCMRNRSFEFPDTQPHKDLVPIRSVLDLEGGVWAPTEDHARIAVGKRPLAENTKIRIAAGRKRFGDKVFYYPYFGSNLNGFTVDAPIWTITTRDRYCLVQGDQMRILNTAEVRAAMGFPPDYRLSGKSKMDKFLLGNAVVPAVAIWLIRKVMEAA
jgi:DNA (cytosine-5)-methyltransferase 1